MAIPVNVFTGFLGAGKTTIIINLIKSLPKDYNMVVLKNEYGDASVDAVLARESNIKITEMINGCLCCVLVGKLGNALDEIISKYNPSRILIETSGTAYPAPIAWEIRKMGPRIKLDSIITVIDAINFTGYKDKSHTAKLQAQYSDIILINKHEDTDENKLDKVLDDIYELNPQTPKIKTNKGAVDYHLLFNIDTDLFESDIDSIRQYDPEHNHEFESFVIKTVKVFDELVLKKFLDKLDKWDLYRIKGPIVLDSGKFFLNFTFGKYSFTKLEKYSKDLSMILVIGKNLGFHKKRFMNDLGLSESDFGAK